MTAGRLLDRLVEGRLACAEDVLELVEAEEEEEGAGRDRALDAGPAEGRCALAKSSFGALWTARPAL
jgi:hypothetical protein